MRVLARPSEHALAVRAHLLADLVVRERLLELVERRDEDLAHLLARRRRGDRARVRALGGGDHGAKLHVVVEQREDVVVDSILFAKVEVEAVAEDLRARVGDEVLGH